MFPPGQIQFLLILTIVLLVFSIVAQGTDTNKQHSDQELPAESCNNHSPPISIADVKNSEELTNNKVNIDSSSTMATANYKQSESGTTSVSATTTTKSYEQDGDEAREIAKYLPYFPFKGIPRFYDIGGFLEKPDVFQQIVDIFVSRYEEIGIDSVAGLDARGFILGPPIALALRKPFIMMRKQGKMPNSISSSAYDTEYGKRSGLTVQKDKINKGDRVLIIDDLVATGGTLSSAINLVHMLGGKVVECACVVELKMFIDPPEETGLPSRTKLFKSTNINHVPVWGLISEDVLTVEASLPEGYVDDGEEH